MDLSEADRQAKDAFFDLVLNAPPPDVEVLLVIARAIGKDGEPLPWTGKLDTANRFMARSI